jgi:tetratricopeptide (TPR) repeat protein
MMPISLSSFNYNTIYGQVQTEETAKVVENDVKESIIRVNSLHDVRNLTGAIEYYDKVLAVNANDTDTLNAKGLTLSQLRKYAEAIPFYDKILDMDPNDAYAFYIKDLTINQLGK